MDRTNSRIVALRFIAELEGRRIRVLVNGEARVALSPTGWEALMILAEHRLTTTTGYTPAEKLSAQRSTLYKTISRMRESIDSTLGRGSGENLIRHAGRSVYYLNLPADAVTVDDEALNLPVDSADLSRLARLASLCRACVSSGGPRESSNNEPDEG